MYYLGMLYTEAYNVPIAIRHWLLKRVQKELEVARNNQNTPTKALHHNDPQARQMMNLQRDNPPSRLRRFS